MMMSLMCATGKMVTFPFTRQSGSEVKTSSLFELVHSDIVGPLKPKTRVCQRIPPEGQRSSVCKFVEFKKLVENQHSARIGCIRSDNSDEYTCAKLNRLCVANGIIHQTSVLRLPQRIGLVERMNWNIAEMARTTLNYVNVERR
ncbi:hypothetical protein PsorP6_009667 [Peronosclerospora sorghi]|uniref:Uncharacterized protein n=1 Tax=Peronosclerospora sorghi TaxID=230839 RepID=A0ACC0W0L7_9STRA|nr:hypothetical protein PsorP6_009667 [Peronosclerospora sorghi]